MDECSNNKKIQKVLPFLIRLSSSPLELVVDLQFGPAPWLSVRRAHQASREQRLWRPAPRTPGTLGRQASSEQRRQAMSGGSFFLRPAQASEAASERAAAPTHASEAPCVVLLSYACETRVAAGNPCGGASSIFIVSLRFRSSQTQIFPDVTHPFRWERITGKRVPPIPNPNHAHFLILVSKQGIQSILPLISLSHHLFPTIQTPPKGRT